MGEEIKKDAWECATEEQTLLALAGDSSLEEYLQDRQQRAEDLIATCHIKSNQRAFEIGSGDGIVAKFLSEQCTFIDCNDVSESFIARAKTTCSNISNVAFHKIRDGYLEHLPADTYDFGYSLNVFIHLNPYDIFNYLRDVQRILKVGGVFYFDACTIGRQTMELFKTHAQYYKEDPTNIRGLLNFNHPELIKSIIDEAGLRISAESYMATDGWLKVLVEKVK